MVTCELGNLPLLRLSAFSHPGLDFLQAIHSVWHAARYRPLVTRNLRVVNIEELDCVLQFALLSICFGRRWLRYWGGFRVAGILRRWAALDKAAPDMRILVVSQYFWPESFVINDLVAKLSSRGNVIEVLTGKPNYPDGNIFAGYIAAGCAEECFAGSVRVCRVPMRPRLTGGGRNLALNYLSFVWNGLRYFHRSVRGRSFDAILVFAPSPITAAIPAIWLKWKLGAHLAIWVQDLWPESLSATGFVRNGVVLRAAGWMVRCIYACADTLLVQSRAFHAPVARYAPAGRIVYYPNFYSNTAHVTDAPMQVPSELLSLLETKFCIVFAGNLGTAQSLETLVGAAERLRKLPELRLVVIGSGSMSEWIERQKVERKLDNLVLAGRFSQGEMPQIFSRAAGLLVTLKRAEIFSYTIPSKIQAYLAAARPVVAALDGEGARIVEEAGAGLTCPAEDADGLACCIERLYRMSPCERSRLGQAGRAYFLQHFELNRQADQLLEVLERGINEKKR